MKRVLILAYDFPPYKSVGGQRPYSWFKYFKENGYYPIVFTKNWNAIVGQSNSYIRSCDAGEVEIREEGEIHWCAGESTISNKLMFKYGENKLRLIRKVFTALVSFCEYYLPIGNKYGVYLGAKDYLKKNKVDIILACGDPFITFKYASKLSKSFYTPWVADYRDPWSLDKGNKSKILINLLKIIERDTLKNVSGIVTVSNYFSGMIKRVLGDRPIEIIENGFELDEKKFSGSENMNVPSGNRMVYAGSLYQWHPIELFLQSIKMGIQGNVLPKDFEVDFYVGLGFDGLKELVKQYELSHIVKVNGLKEHTEIIKLLKAAKVLLLFNDYNIVGSKIYEFLALKKPILFCFENDKEAFSLKEIYFDNTIKSILESKQSELIQEYKGGWIIKEKNDLDDWIMNYYERLEEFGEVNITSEQIYKLSRRYKVVEYAEYLNNILNKNE